MADYFYTILKPRIQKVVYSSKWKDGKPQNTDGISHIFKYVILEQYEDTLNNIEFAQKRLGEDAFHDYLLRYLLEAGTRESMSRFGVTAITDPWAYELKIYDENIAKYQKVDLIETFNYLLGIHVKQYRTFTNGKVKYRVSIGEKADALFIIIWRKTDGLDLKADKKFVEKEILPGIRARYPSTSEKIYINGTSHVNGADAIEPEFSRLMGG
jgi:adenine-specific DNA-methyltransferase